MSTTAKLLAFMAALLVGVFATAYRHDPTAIDAALHTSHLHVQDWLILFVGSACVGSVVYGLLWRPDSVNWGWSIWLVIGGVMIYAEVADVPWLKETSCKIINSRHHGPWTEPCYRPD